MLDHLPFDALLRVCTLLDVKSLGMLSETCSTLNDAVSDDEVWYKKYSQHSARAQAAPTPPFQGTKGPWKFEFRRRTREMHVCCIENAHSDAVFALDSLNSYFLSGSDDGIKVWNISGAAPTLSATPVFSAELVGTDFVTAGHFLGSSPSSIACCTRNGEILLYDGMMTARASSNSFSSSSYGNNNTSSPSLSATPSPMSCSPTSPPALYIPANESVGHTTTTATTTTATTMNATNTTTQKALPLSSTQFGASASCMANLMAGSPGEGAVVMVGGGKGRVGLFDFRIGGGQACVWHERVHEDTVLSLHCLSTDVIAGGGRDKTVRCFDIRTGKTLAIQWTGNITRCISSGGGRVVTGGGSRMKPLLSLWSWGGGNVNLASPPVRLLGHTDAVFSTVMDSDHTLISAASDGTVRLWDMSSLAPVRALHSAKAITSMIAGSKGRIICGCSDGTIMAWNLEKLKLLVPEPDENAVSINSPAVDELQQFVDLEIMARHFFR